MVKTYEKIDFDENYEQMDEVFIDYHGAAMKAVMGKGEGRKEIKHFGQLIDVIGDAKVDMRSVPPTF